MHVYSPRPGADNPLVTKFWRQQKAQITLTICCKFQNDLLEFWFYTHILIILYTYIAPGKGRQTLGVKILMSTESSYHFDHLLQVSKNLFEFWFLYTFFNVFSTSPGQGQTTLCGQNSDVNRKAFGHLLQVSKNIFEVWFYTYFCLFLYMYIAPGQGQSTPGVRIFILT